MQTKIKLRDELELLRETATCRCAAIMKKIDKVVDGEYYPCCWVCCDCSIDSYEAEWEE